MSYEFRAGKRYKFDTWAPAILGTDFGAVYVLQTLLYQDALREEDVSSLNAQVLAVMQSNPAVTQQPVDYRQLNYIKVRTASGTTRIIASEWIRTDTVQLISRITANVTIMDVTPSDVDVISAALVQNGFTAFNISLTTE